MSRAASSLCRSAFVSVIASLLTAAAAQSPPPASEPIRVGIRARNGGADRLTSLRYIGGFETKTMLLETLVRRGSDGRLVPGLATRWSIEDGGKTFLLELREGAKFHDGTPVTADAVATHFRRWMNLPEHDWLRVNRHLTKVTADSERVVRLEVDRPYAVLEDLLAINPCAVVAPSAKDWEGEFVRPIGTGPFRFVGAYDEGKRWRVTHTGGTGPTLDVTFYPRGRDATPLDDLQRGTLDVFVGGWDEDLPAERLDAMASDPRFAVQVAPGSSVVYLSFRISEGPTADRAVRERVAAALRRDALIAAVEGGRAEACTTWAAPSVAFWPRGPASVRPRAPAAPGPSVKLRLAAGRVEGRASRAAEAVAAQLREAGFEIELLGGPVVNAESPKAVVDAHGAVTPLTTESGEVRAAAGAALRRASEGADLRIEITHGMPYCPHQSLIARFGAPAPGKPDRVVASPRLRELVEQAASEPDATARLPIYTQIQDLLDREVLIVPLYVPWRVAVRAVDIDGIELGPDVYHAEFGNLHRRTVR